MTFITAPGTRRHGKALAQAAGTFMQRVAKMSAHLDRRVVSYSPKPWEKVLRIGGGQNVVMAGGSSCGGYDDFGGYDCAGGGVEGGGGGGTSEPSGGCYGQCDYPSGNNNGDPAPGPFDPTTGEGIDPNAPEVVIVGQRPQQGTEAPPENWTFNPPPMPVPVIVPIPINVEEAFFIPVGCIPGPRRTFVCPPALPANPGAIPPVTMPKPQSGFVWKWQWSDIQWCKVWNNCDPKANEGEQPKAPAVTPAEKFIQAMAVCRAAAKAHMEYCVRMQDHREEAANRQCGQDAIDNYLACEMTAKDLYNNGAGR